MQTCHFIPAYILQNILEAKTAPDEARTAARRTLSADQDIREQRANASAATVVDPPGISAARAPIVSSGFVPLYVLEHIAQSGAAGDEAR